MSKKKVSVKTSLSYDEAVSYMEELLAGLKSGRIEVRKGDDCVTLTPGEQVEIEVAAKVKKDKQKFSFKLTCSHVEEEVLTIGTTNASIPANPEPSELATKPEAQVPATQETSAPTEPETDAPAPDRPDN